MKPMLKYSGGKSKEIPQFINYIPTDYDRYIEPFIGGGAVYFYLEPEKAIINDINAKLINFYSDIRDKYDAVKNQLDVLDIVYTDNQSEFRKQCFLYPNRRNENKNEALYYRLRDMYNGKIPAVYRDSVLYFFINKTAYSGMTRYNSKGEFNVPFGRYVGINSHYVTRKHHNLLQKATILNCDYSEVFKMATKDDFMFLDPPYDCVFNDYGNLNSKDGFDEYEQRRLADNYKKLECRALMVIGKTPLTEDLYGDYIKTEYEKNYSVNIRNRFKATATHLIVTNY